MAEMPATPAQPPRIRRIERAAPLPRPSARAGYAGAIASSLALIASAGALAAAAQGADPALLWTQAAAGALAVPPLLLVGSATARQRRTREAEHARTALRLALTSAVPQAMVAGLHAWGLSAPGARLDVAALALIGAGSLLAAGLTGWRAADGIARLVRGAPPP